MPEGVGMSREKLAALKELVGGRGCVVRHGYMVYAWGDQSKSSDVASAFKPVLSTLLFMAIQEGRLKSADDLVVEFEPRFKSLNNGKDATMTWRHLASQMSGYGLAEAPGGARFLADRERSYVHILTLGTSLARAEDHLKKLLAHPDKGVAGMARTELNLVEIKRQPYELSFTAFDGKPVDFAQLRGKVVVLYFWSSTNKGSIGALDALKQIASDYRKKGLEVVTVSYDKAEDREKLAAAIKENRISWPVHFDGKGAKAEFAAKLNITGVPALLVFDQKGMLLHTMQGTNLTVNLPVNQLDGQVRRMFGIK